MKDSITQKRSEREAVQRSIRAKFDAAKFEDSKKRLCDHCDFYSDSKIHCKYKLLPITSEGYDCPYFKLLLL